jgi:hypothetical protein
MSSKRKIQSRPKKQDRTPDPRRALLCSRLQAAAKLSVSIATLVRLEKAGVIRPVKLFPDTPNCQVRYRVTEIERLALRGDA